MLAAIASHKLVVGFCLGAELSSSEETTACKYFTSISMFSFGSVLGIGLGLGVTDLNKRLPQLVAPILQVNYRKMRKKIYQNMHILVKNLLILLNKKQYRTSRV